MGTSHQSTHPVNKKGTNGTLTLLGRIGRLDSTKYMTLVPLQLIGIDGHGPLASISSSLFRPSMRAILTAVSSAHGLGSLSPTHAWPALGWICAVLLDPWARYMKFLAQYLIG